MVRPGCNQLRLLPGLQWSEEAHRLHSHLCLHRVAQWRKFMNRLYLITRKCNTLKCQRSIKHFMYQWVIFSPQVMLRYWGSAGHQFINSNKIMRSRVQICSLSMLHQGQPQMLLCGIAEKHQNIKRFFFFLNASGRKLLDQNFNQCHQTT